MIPANRYFLHWRGVEYEVLGTFGSAPERGKFFAVSVDDPNATEQPELVINSRLGTGIEDEAALVLVLAQCFPGHSGVRLRLGLGLPMLRYVFSSEGLEYEAIGQFGKGNRFRVEPQRQLQASEDHKHAARFKVRDVANRTELLAEVRYFLRDVLDLYPG